MALFDPRLPRSFLIAFCMNKQSLIKIAVKGLLATVGLLALLAVLSIFLLPMGGHLVVFHLAFGFFLFLSSNLGDISVNADTWVPGVLAMIIALVILHRLLGSWARRTNRKWTISSTFALGMILPVLFATAFLVPGILLQVKTLGNTSWFDRNRGQVFMSDSRLQAVWSAAIEYFYENPKKETGEHYPETIEHLLEPTPYIGHPALRDAQGKRHSG
jgi:hypothetical protein